MCRRASSCLRWTIHPGAWSRPRGASGSGVDRSGGAASHCALHHLLVGLLPGDQAVDDMLPQVIVQTVVLAERVVALGLGHLGLALVDRDAHLGVEVARRGAPPLRIHSWYSALVMPRLFPA